ncbi:MAG: hypothetical protein WAV07_16755 [Candidatus Contendobacter sp.]
MTTNPIAMSEPTQTCLICQAPLSFFQMRKSKLCGRGECNWRYALLQKQHEVCVVCGCPLAARELPNQVCANPDCQRAAVADRARHVYEQNQARDAAFIQQEIEQAERLRDRVMSAFGLREPDTFPLVVIPASTAGIVKLPEQRRRAFRDHLDSLISQANASPAAAPTAEESAPPPAARESEVQAVLSRACACCKGSCCGGGGDHAYLSVETLRRYQAANPGQHPAEVLAAYLERMGDRTVAGSCIYHRADGCALPRAMRADLCNRHYCKALLEFQRDLPATGSIRAFFVAANSGAIQTAALVHETRMLIVQGEGEPER